MVNVIILGPSLSAVSGVSTHVRHLLNSSLSGNIRCVHFQVGSQGRRESWIGKAFRFLFSPLHLMIKILLLRPAIVHLNTSIDPKAFWRDAVYLCVARICRQKAVYQIHGGELPEAFFPTQKLRRAFFKKILQLADVVVLLAELERHAYESFTAPKRLCVIPNAIDLAPYRDLPQKKFDHNPLTLAYLGALVPGKGLAHVLEALHILKLQDNFPDIKFVIAGSGPAEASLKRQANTLGLDSIVHFRGPLFDKEKLDFWEESDIFIFPTFSEGLPYAVLESLASGTPVITTPVGGLPDVITHEKHGLFVTPGSSGELAQAIKRLIADKTLLRRMSANCRQRAQEYYGIERMVLQFREVYQSLISN